MRKINMTILVTCMFMGCSSGGGGGQIASAPKPTASENGTPVVPLFYSEYPSWGVFASANDLGLIDARAGWQGSIEKKHGVDLELLLRPYDTCLAEYGSNGGAVCITNTDIVGIAKGRPSVAILPTSTSYGADACTVIGVKTIDDLKNKKVTVYGLEKSVSDYAFYRCIQNSGANPEDFSFSNRDPEAAAQALQANRIQAAMLWNPFVIQTLKTQPISSVLFDTTSIPDEVIDMVVMDQLTLDKPGGKAAAQCIVDTYYEICNRLRNPETSEDAFTSLKDKFAPNLTTEDMRNICQLGESEDKGYKTKFYDTPESGIAVFQQEHLSPIMTKVTEWAKIRQTIDGDVESVTQEEYSRTKDENKVYVIFDDIFMKKCQ